MNSYLTNLPNMNTTVNPKALKMALSQPVSLVLAGPYSGDLELLRAIRDAAGNDTAICAPAGFHAMKLSQKLGCTAYPTVSAPVLGSGHIIISDAQMLSRADFNSVMRRKRVGARLTLIGDDRQLCSETFSELLASEISAYRLRSDPSGNALRHNLARFPSVHGCADLRFDDSFQMIELPDGEVKQRIVDDAVKFWQSESVRVLFATANGSLLMSELDRAINDRVDPFTDDRSYACTAKAAQGCKYGTILIPVLPSMEIDRVTLYTALCCAVNKVVIYGNRQALNAIMRQKLAKEVA